MTVSGVLSTRSIRSAFNRNTEPESRVSVIMGCTVLVRRTARDSPSMAGLRTLFGAYADDLSGPCGSVETLVAPGRIAVPEVATPEREPAPTPWEAGSAPAGSNCSSALDVDQVLEHL